MILDVGAIFDKSAAAFDAEIGILESSSAFSTKYIESVSDADIQREMDSAYMLAICDSQREGFIVGFRAAVQLMANCMPQSIEK